MDMIKLKLPLFGNLIHKTAITRFAQTLGTLLGSGVAIVEALEICKGVVGNRLIAKEVETIRDAIREGKQLMEPLKSARFFPPMFAQMVEVGEQTGRLDQMLERVAQYYEEEVDAAVEAITSAIEPLMMVVLGGMVGGLLIAMYLPIFSLAGG
jgi:type IV pilus assembly protein PilC